MTTLQMIRTHVLAALLTTLPLATVSTASAAPAKTGYARSGDLDLYYEVHGSGGMPLVVLQGSFCTIEICFGQMLPTLAAKRQVILIDQQGHGRTLMAKNHPFSVTQMKKDSIAVMKKHVRPARREVKTLRGTSSASRSHSCSSSPARRTSRWSSTSRP